MTHVEDDRILALHAKLVEAITLEHADTLMSLLPRADWDRVAAEHGVERPVRPVTR